MTEFNSDICVIKKYSNRRLYDTSISRYITLTDVRDLVMERKDFVVVDAKTEEDLTRSVLLQILLEEEIAGTPMFSEQALADLIRLYGFAMQGMMAPFLEKNIQAALQVQASLAEQSRSLTPELWSRYIGMQTPTMQHVLSTYIKQSQSMLTRMQEQMSRQTAQIIDSFGLPGSKHGD